MVGNFACSMLTHLVFASPFVKKEVEGEWSVTLPALC